MDGVEIQSKVEARSTERVLSPFLRLSLLLGVLVHIAGFLIFRVISNPLPVQEETSPFVQYVPSAALERGAVLEEQAALFDSAPLFVPGVWNAANNLTLPSADRGLLRFPSYLPPMDVAGALLPEGITVDPGYEVGIPEDLLAFRFWNLFDGIGSERRPVEPLPETSAFAEVRSLAGGAPTIFPVDLEVLSYQATRPARFFIRVEPDGRVLGGPVLSSSSGDTIFDEAAFDWLSRGDAAGRFSRGYQEVRVFP